MQKLTAEIYRIVAGRGNREILFDQGLRFSKTSLRLKETLKVGPPGNLPRFSTIIKLLIRREVSSLFWLAPQLPHNWSLCVSACLLLSTCTSSFHIGAAALGRPGTRPHQEFYWLMVQSVLSDADPLDQRIAEVPRRPPAKPSKWICVRMA